MKRKFTEITKDVHPQLDGNHRIAGILTKMLTYEGLLKQYEPQVVTSKKGHREKKSINGQTNCLPMMFLSDTNNH